MGNKACSLKKKELRQLSVTSKFPEDDIRLIFQHFLTLVPPGEAEKEPQLDKSTFNKALGHETRNSMFVSRVFEVFDSNSDGKITFSEFLHGLAALSPSGSFKEKLDFCFRIYDLNGDGLVSMEELCTLVHDMLQEQGVEISQREAMDMCERTFAEADVKSRKMTKDEFRRLAEARRTLLAPFTLNVSDIISEQKAAAASHSGN